MSESLIIALIVTATIAGFIGTGVYFLLRFLRGTLEIHPATVSISSGETFNGRVELQAKQPLEAERLSIFLECEQFQHRRSSTGGRSSSWHVIYSQEAILDTSPHYAARFSQSFPYTLTAPSKEDMGRGGIPEGLETILKAIQAFRGDGRIRWRLRARLFAKGVDLQTTMRVNVLLK